MSPATHGPATHAPPPRRLVQQVILFIKITSIPYADSNTNIAGGLDLARTQVLSDTSGRNANRPNYKDIVVLISDGADNMNTRDRVSQAGKDIRNFGGTDNVHVITIGIGG